MRFPNPSCPPHRNLPPLQLQQNQPPKTSFLWLKNLKTEFPFL
jgi:hypothetical protein